ncbi:MAG TPA: hypothetical protein VFC92_08990 [Bacteroidales bacterium]|nr:hypothetical protein [Bacteroidales bacterium]
MLFLIPLSIIFSSCETDVDVNAEWKEITIVYGLLNQQDATHYLRINKAFLGGNALEIAKIADSSSYGGSLEVKLQGINLNNNQMMQEISFDTVTINNKDSGDFYNPYMLVYKASAQLDPDLSYSLLIRNTTNDREITAQTKLINSFAITKPPSGGRANFVRSFTTEFAWRNAVNGKRYQPTIRFHYMELPAGSSDTIHKFIDWKLPVQFADDIFGNGSQSIAVNNDAFYSFINNNVKPREFSGKRFCSTIDFMVTAAGIEYDTYMRVNGPSGSLVQDKPEYTNINNGFGVLSSRLDITKERHLHPQAEDEIMLLELGFVKNLNL